ncbi:DUF4148 domain-containing protein [Burkholderia sp. SRS-W-2-2016]|uniref:DUF4148 domain-containing protein n=1 Tax=Burkholderia sp. SRS-W-2-2016 TaxID=1926878 RepID=UPI0021171EEB|nr:DUF4148 domain-containing protein [Burkholderia sp. SRS-W-2-2016]
MPNNAVTQTRRSAVRFGRPADFFPSDLIQENAMKVPMIALTLAVAACATAGSAYAANYAANAADPHAATAVVQAEAQWTPPQSAPQAKTRAEVRQELARARTDGQLAALNKIYQGS